MRSPMRVPNVLALRAGRDPVSDRLHVCADVAGHGSNENGST
jgi:hypothetical protein